MHAWPCPRDSPNPAATLLQVSFSPSFLQRQEGRRFLASLFKLDVSLVGELTAIMKNQVRRSIQKSTRGCKRREADCRGGRCAHVGGGAGGLPYCSQCLAYCKRQHVHRPVPRADLLRPQVCAGGVRRDHLPCLEGDHWTLPAGAGDHVHPGEPAWEAGAAGKGKGRGGWEEGCRRAGGLRKGARQRGQSEDAYRAV